MSASRPQGVCASIRRLSLAQMGLTDREGLSSSWAGRRAPGAVASTSSPPRPLPDDSAVAPAAGGLGGQVEAPEFVPKLCLTRAHSSAFQRTTAYSDGLEKWRDL